MLPRLLLKNAGGYKLIYKRNPTSIRSASAAVASTHEVLKDRGDSTELSSLSNGLRVATYNNNQSLATVGVWVNSGSKFEHSENNGVASLYEHLIYAGSTKRSGQQLQKDLAKIGAQMNSFTTRDHTAYFVNCLASDVEKAVEILADGIKNSSFSAEQIESQRSLLLKKIQEADANHHEVLLDHLHKTAFQGTTYSFAPIGTEESVKNLSKKDVEDFVHDNYKPFNMVLAGAGGVDHATLANAAQKHFGQAGNAFEGKMPDPRYHVGVRFTGSELKATDDSAHAMHGAVAVEGVPRSHGDYLALQVASQLVGQHEMGPNVAHTTPSKLAQKLSTVDTYRSYQNFSFSYANTGLFGACFSVDGSEEEDAGDVVRAILKQWKYLAHAVTDEEVRRAKNQLITRWLSQLENSCRLANHVATGVLSTGKVTPLHHLERSIHYIDASAVQGAVARHVYDRDCATVALGRTDAMPDYWDVRSAMSWWRI